MSETIVVAAIAFAGTVLGTFGGIMTSNKLTTYRISELEKRVDKHNNLIERTYQLEEEQKVQKEQIKVANHRIEDLEEKEN